MSNSPGTVWRILEVIQVLLSKLHASKATKIKNRKASRKRHCKRCIQRANIKSFSAVLQLAVANSKRLRAPDPPLTQDISNAGAVNLKPFGRLRRGRQLLVVCNQLHLSGKRMGMGLFDGKPAGLNIEAIHCRRADEGQPKGIAR